MKKLTSALAAITAMAFLIAFLLIPIEFDDLYPEDNEYYV
jgi:hypothetical protein